jgi:hypothetical protein
MSKEFDRIIQEINKSNKDLYEADAKIKKELNSVEKDITGIKKDIGILRIQVQEISNKVDILLDIMQNLSIMVLEDEDQESFDNEYNDFDSDQTWVPEDDDWSNNEDES